MPGSAAGSRRLAVIMALLCWAEHVLAVKTTGGGLSRPMLECWAGAGLGFFFFSMLPFLHAQAGLDERGEKESKGMR